MNIQFKEVLPHPLKEIKHQDRSIWGSSFSLEKGHKILLNAASGKGKTTFTHILAGIRNDFNGQLFIDNEDSSAISPEKWAEIRQKKMAFIFQDLQLFNELTVRENLLIKHQLAKKESEETIQKMVELLGIGDKWEIKCGLLSMGQQQRVAIIRALIQPFEWLIMDEPFSHLDEQNTLICLDLIHQKCKEQNAGFVLTSLGSKHEKKYDKELYL